jgi:hypothetical protein
MVVRYFPNRVFTFLHFAVQSYPALLQPGSSTLPTVPCVAHLYSRTLRGFICLTGRIFLLK